MAKLVQGANTRRKSVLGIVLVSLIVYLFSCSISFGSSEGFCLKTANFIQYTKELYSELGFSESVISFQAFSASVTAYYIALGKNFIKKPYLLTIIDYTQPSEKERFFVIDLRKRKILFKELVAHGKKSGKRYAQYFSNKPGSLKSSIGLYVTLSTYIGNYGYSLRLKGLEKGFNDNAQRRNIVIHGAWYVNRKMAKYLHWLGRSWGCPALSLNSVKKVIDTIKDGSALYIYYPLKNYIQTSRYLNLQKAALVFNQKIAKTTALMRP